MPVQARGSRHGGDQGISMAQRGCAAFPCDVYDPRLVFKSGDVDVSATSAAGSGAVAVGKSTRCQIVRSSVHRVLVGMHETTLLLGERPSWLYKNHQDLVG